MLLETTDSYLDRQKAVVTVNKLTDYITATEVTGSSNSPFVGPLRGIGNLDKAFSKVATLNGTVDMSYCAIDEIVIEEGRAVSVRISTGFAAAPAIICEPSEVTGMDKT